MQLIVFHNAANSFLHANSVKVHQLKAKDSEINSYPLCLGNISKGFTVGNMKKKSEWKSVDVSVNHNTVAISNIVDNRKYLMVLYKCLDTIRKRLLFW